MTGTTKAILQQIRDELIANESTLDGMVHLHRVKIFVQVSPGELFPKKVNLQIDIEKPCGIQSGKSRLMNDGNYQFTE